MNKDKIQQIIRECIYKTINEGTTFDDTTQKWELLKEQVGCEQMVEDIFNYLSSDQLEQLVEWFNEDYDLW
jgi:hypothetical protein